MQSSNLDKAPLTNVSNFFFPFSKIKNFKSNLFKFYQPGLIHRDFIILQQLCTPTLKLIKILRILVMETMIT